MSERDELVARLHGPYQWGYRDPMDDAGFVADDSPSIAADQIERDGREIERLREALQPFVVIADIFDSEVEGHSDTDELSLFYGDRANWMADRFTLAKFNAARAALNGEGET